MRGITPNADRAADHLDAPPDAREPLLVGGVDPHEVLESMGDIVCVLRNDGIIVSINRATESLLGWRAADLFGRNFLDYLHPDEIERALNVLAMSNSFGTSPTPGTYRFRRSDEAWETLEVLGTPLGTDVPPRAFVAVLRRSHDAVVLNEIVNALVAGTDTQTLMQLVVNLAGWRDSFFRSAVTWEDEPGRVVQVGDALPDVLTGGRLVPGSPWADAADRAEEQFVSRGDLAPQLATAAEASGVHTAWILPVAHPRASRPALFTVWTTAEGLDVAISAFSAAMVRQLLELILGWRRQQDDLAWAATHDELTKLHNRAAFYTELQRLDRRDCAVVHIDLDGFKPVNDTHGHLVGDAVLAAVAGRLAASVRDGDIVARLGGDEFAALCPGADLDTAVLIGRRMQQQLERPLHVLGTDVTIGASIGVAIGPATEDLLDRADQAQLTAKRAGGGTIHH